VNSPDSIGKVVISFNFSRKIRNSPGSLRAMSFHQAVATLAMHFLFVSIPVSFPNRVSRRFFSWFPFRKLSAYLPRFRSRAFPMLSVFGVPNHILSVLLGPRPSLACLPSVAGLPMSLFLVSFLLISFVFIEILLVRVLILPTAPVSLVLRFTPLRLQ
jgi:hypothetical protein